ncbi:MULTISPECIES: MepB family protein [unclassified Streptomyces]|uniref:MepB family protein n=1 Tax=unclassified Streptomyces TaxID=2593676 RepID=UPI000F5BD3C7|nr:MepB family protein [Streptomyces sp. ADI95-17]WSG51050.1 MepB family protein [Streptomyces sp. NBC_01732]WSX01714.1 MepB family protein [Streptomyces sp. NBC_00987]
MAAHSDPRPAPWPDGAPLHPDLLAAKALVYDPSGLVCSRPVPEAESAEYGAHGFTVDGSAVRFRVARTTPTKVGQFVTVWKRSADGGPIRPYDSGDPVDLFVISTRDTGDTGDAGDAGDTDGISGAGGFGQFVFPRAVLRERDIVSTAGVGGKRGFRVYPPWVTTTNRQAGRTQKWQVEYFLPVPDGEPADPDRCRALYRP